MFPKVQRPELMLQPRLRSVDLWDFRTTYVYVFHELFIVQVEYVPCIVNLRIFRLLQSTFHAAFFPAAHTNIYGRFHFTFVLFFMYLRILCDARALLAFQQKAIIHRRILIVNLHIVIQKIASVKRTILLRRLERSQAIFRLLKINLGLWNYMESYTLFKLNPNFWIANGHYFCYVTNFLILYSIPLFSLRR